MAGRSLAVVDQSVNTMKKLDQYITTGQDIAIDLALDLVENDREDSLVQVSNLEDIMIEYIQMEWEQKQFLQAVENVKQKAKGTNCDLEKMLDDELAKIKEAEKGTDEKSHPKFVEMSDKVKDALQEGEEVVAPTQPALASIANDEDIEMTQAEVQTKCPYTRKDMVNPVRNKHCGHNYDKEGIMDLIKHRGNRAKCPVVGCGNNVPLDPADMEPDKQLKAYIAQQNRQQGKNKRTKKK